MSLDKWEAFSGVPCDDPAELVSLPYREVAGGPSWPDEATEPGLGDWIYTAAGGWQMVVWP